MAFGSFIYFIQVSPVLSARRGEPIKAYISALEAWEMISSRMAIYLFMMKFNAKLRGAVYCVPRRANGPERT